MSDHTITQSHSEEAKRASGKMADQLVLLLECDRPLAGSARHRLTGTDEVVIGRGLARQNERTGARLGLRVPDCRMSTLHASIRRHGHAYIISDAGSKNGVLVNGRRIERELLRDRDIIECGHTFFLFLMGQSASGGTPLDVDGAELSNAPSGLATFHEPLAAQVRALPDVARASLPILVLGASGTGKELVARAVHELSQRRGPFLEVRCGALPDVAGEADLLGAARGSFVDPATLFLDEIGDLPARAQPALLKVLDDGSLPLGVVAATHRDLGALAQKDQFRADLLARVGGFTVRLPSLRERLEDFGLLASALLARYGTPETTLSSEALRLLLAYEWPLNVRELEHCLRAALAVSASSRIDVLELPPSLRPAVAVEAAPAARPQRSLTLEQLSRREELCALLSQHRRNISAVARELGKDRVQIRRWIKQLDISLEEIAS
jgi:hypothetical protein